MILKVTEGHWNCCDLSGSTSLQTDTTASTVLTVLHRKIIHIEAITQGRGSAGLSPRVAPCQNLRGGAHSTISVLIIEKS